MEIKKFFTSNIAFVLSLLLLCCVIFIINLFGSFEINRSIIYSNWMSYCFTYSILFESVYISYFAYNGRSLKIESELKKLLISLLIGIFSFGIIYYIILPMFTILFAIIGFSS
jgi:hypothetical protein